MNVNNVQGFAVTNNPDQILAPDHSPILLELVQPILDYSSTGEILTWRGVSRDFLAKADLVDACSRNLVFRIASVFRDVISRLDPVDNQSLIEKLTQIQSELKHQHFPDLTSFKRYALPIANRFIDALSQDPSISLSGMPFFEIEESLTETTTRMNCFRNVIPVVTLRRVADSTLVDANISAAERDLLLSTLIHDLMDTKTPEGMHQAIEFVNTISDARVQSRHLDTILGEILLQMQTVTMNQEEARNLSLFKNYVRVVEIAEAMAEFKFLVHQSVF
jgi:hypothetical protein